MIEIQYHDFHITGGFKICRICGVNVKERDKICLKRNVPRDLVANSLKGYSLTESSPIETNTRVNIKPLSPRQLASREDYQLQSTDQYNFQTGHSPLETITKLRSLTPRQTESLQSTDKHNIQTSSSSASPPPEEKYKREMEYQTRKVTLSDLNPQFRFACIEPCYYMGLFDIQDCNCSPFGYIYGDIVQYHDRKYVVVGVKADSSETRVRLWWWEFGTKGAVCPKQIIQGYDVKERYILQDGGPEGTPVHLPIFYTPSSIIYSNTSPTSMVNKTNSDDYSARHYSSNTTKDVTQRTSRPSERSNPTRRIFSNPATGHTTTTAPPSYHSSTTYNTSRTPTHSTIPRSNALNAVPSTNLRGSYNPIIIRNPSHR